MRILRFSWLPLLLLLTGCAMTSATVNYDVGLDQVERPTDAAERYGEYTVTEQDTTEGTKYVYNDELLTAGWLYGGDSMFLSLQNKTDYSIRILLNEGAFVLPSGSSQRILTGDMSYAERNEEVQPIIVPSGASSSAFLIPSDNINFNQYSGVTVESILPPGRITEQAQTSSVEQNIGKTFSVLLPIEIQDTVNEYTFTFKVNGARVEGNSTIQSRTFGDYANN